MKETITIRVSLFRSGVLADESATVIVDFSLEPPELSALGGVMVPRLYKRAQIECTKRISLHKREEVEKKSSTG